MANHSFENVTLTKAKDKFYCYIPGCSFTEPLRNDCERCLCVGGLSAEIFSFSSHFFYLPFQVLFLFLLFCFFFALFQ